MSNLVYFHQNTAFGATERYLADLASGMAERGMSVHMICPDAPAIDGFDALKASGVKVSRLETNLFSQNALIAIPRVAKVFGKLRPEIIHFNDPCTVGILASRLAGVRTLVMTHHTPELRRLYNRRGHLLENVAFRLLSHVIFTTERDRRTGAERDHLAPTKSSVVYYGVRLSEFSETLRDQRAHVRRELGIDEHASVVVNVARLSPQKGHTDLIDAAAEVLMNRRDLVFLLAGDGESRGEIERKIQQMSLTSYFRLLGHRTDIPRILAASDLFVLSSSFEGGCYAVLEAMASRLPVVATAVGGVSESVLDGVTGRLVSANQPRTLARAITEVLATDDRGRKMGHEGRRRVETSFAMEQMLQGTYTMYQQLSDRIRPGGLKEQVVAGSRRTAN